MKKRFLTCLLVLCMVLVLLPDPVFAADSDFHIDENGVLTRYYGSGGDVVIPNGVTAIGDNAFNRCESLTSVTIPDSVTSIGSHAFYGTPWQKNQGDFVIVNGILLKYQGNDDDVIIPDGVTSICGLAFNGCWQLTSVTFPDSVTKIGERAFSSCGNLTSVTIPDGVTTIENETFYLCQNLTSVTIPNSVTTIGDEAFSDCTSLTSVTIPSSVTSIGDEAFYNTPWQKNLGDFAVVNGILLAYHGIGGDVVIPDDVTTIGGKAFYSCQNLTSVTIPNSVTTIGDEAFHYCQNLTSVTIPDGVTSIGAGAFYSCQNLTSVAIPDSVTYIGNWAFQYCTSLTDMTISGNVSSIGGQAFSGCTSLTDVTISGSVSSIGGLAFSDCTSLTNVTISGSVAEIDDWAFSDCTALEEVTNHPDTAFNKRQAVNKALLNGWSNPGQYITSQSARITALANEITDSLTSDYEKTKAIAAWVSENIEYDYDYYYGRKGTVTIDPEGVLDSKLTVCDGYSRLTQALLQAAGIPARYISGSADGVRGWEGHAWNLAFADGRWFWLDTTWGMKYFDCGTTFMSLEHVAANGGYSASADDTPSDWAQSEVWEAICAGLVPNDLQAAYRNGMTREEFCRIMITLLEKTAGQSIDAYLASKDLTMQAPFTDTNNAAVLAAYALGIVNGTSATTFNPDGSITRQEAATMLARTARILGLSAGKSENFNDAGQFASWASEGIAFVSGLTDPISGNKVMNGTGNGNFSPTNNFSREQAIITALRIFHCAA